MEVIKQECERALQSDPRMQDAFMRAVPIPKCLYVGDTERAVSSHIVAAGEISRDQDK